MDCDEIVKKKKTVNDVVKRLQGILQKAYRSQIFG